MTIVVEATTPLQSYCVDTVAYFVSNVDVDFSLKVLINFEHLPPGSGGALKCFLHIGKTYRHHTEYHTIYGN